MRKVRVLFFSADPASAHGHAPRLLLDEEERQIRQKVRMSNPGALEFDSRTAARTDDLLQALNEVRPQVVHFSGHGSREGLELVSADGGRPHRVPVEALKQLFGLFRAHVRLVVLSACYSEPQARAIADVVGCAIGTRGAISDTAAITFGASFYRAIAFGLSVEKAYEQACAAMALEHIHEGEHPALVARPGMDPARLVLVPADGSDPAARNRASLARRQASAALRRARAGAGIDDFKAATGARLRASLQQKVPRLDLASLRAPLQDVLWLPGVFRKPDAGWSTGEVREGSAAGHLSPETAESEAPGGAARPSAPERVTVIVAEGGAGKSVLIRLLALGLLDGSCVVPGLAALLSGRDLPVLVDLREASAGLLAGHESPADAARRCIRAASGADPARLLESVELTRRGIILLDEIEALPWHDDQAGRSAALLASLLSVFPGVPRIVAARPPGEARVAAALRAGRGRHAERYAAFVIAPVTQGDLPRVAAVHLYGGREAPASVPDDPRVRSLVHNRDIRRFAVSPLFVNIALDTATGAAGAAALRTDQIIGRYYDQMMDRGRADRDEPLPISARSMRDLLHEVAFRMVADGGLELSERDLLGCAEGLGLSAGEVRRAAAWLRDRTDLVAAGPGGGLSFTHDWYRETLAAEELAEHRSADEIFALAGSTRWYEPVKYSLGLVRPEAARGIIVRLLDAGLEDLALDGCVQVAARLSTEAGDELLGRLDRVSLGGLSRRLALATAVSELETPLARALLVSAALPLRTLSAQDAFDVLIGQKWAPPQTPDETLRIQALRVASSDHLRVMESFRDDGGLIIGYAGEDGEFGGSWATASVYAFVARDRLPHGTRTPVEVLEAVLTRANEHVVTSIADAALSRPDTPDQLRLVALALVAERMFAEAGRGAPPLRGQVELLLRGLQEMPRSESPAFTIGLVNALLTRAPLPGEPDLVAGLMAVRRAAILEYAKHLATFYRRTLPDEGSPAAPGQPATLPVEQSLARLQAGLREAAAHPPVPSAPAAWKQRSLFDSYIASSGFRIHKLKAKDTTGRWAYYFVLVDKEFDAAFLKATEEEGTLDLEDYGYVLASCYGEQPTHEIRDMLYEKYGFALESTAGKSK